MTTKEQVDDLITQYTILIHRHGPESKEVRAFENTNKSNSDFMNKLFIQYSSQVINALTFFKHILNQSDVEEEWLIYLATELENKIEQEVTKKQNL